MTNLKTVNKKCQKNQTAWNSDNEGIKETFTQTKGDTTQQRRLPCPGDYLRPRPLTTERVCRDKKKKNAPNERTDQNSIKKLSDEQIANLSDGEFKTLVMKMLTELIELGLKMKKQMKGT